MQKHRAFKQVLAIRGRRPPAGARLLPPCHADGGRTSRGGQASGLTTASAMGWGPSRPRTGPPVVRGGRSRPPPRAKHTSVATGPVVEGPTTRCHTRQHARPPTRRACSTAGGSPMARPFVPRLDGGALPQRAGCRCTLSDAGRSGACPGLERNQSSTGGGRQGDAPPAAADHSAGHGESTPRVKNGNTRRESMTIDASHKHVQGPEGERDDRTCPEHNHRVTHLPVALTGHGARVGSSTQSGPALLTPHTTPASTGDMQRPTPAVRRRYCSRRVTPPRGASGRVLL